MEWFFLVVVFPVPLFWRFCGITKGRSS